MSQQLPERRSFSPTKTRQLPLQDEQISSPKAQAQTGERLAAQSAHDVSATTMTTPNLMQCFSSPALRRAPSPTREHPTSMEAKANAVGLPRNSQGEARQAANDDSNGDAAATSDLTPPVDVLVRVHDAALNGAFLQYYLFAYSVASLSVAVQGKECVVTGEHIEHTATVWPHIPSGALEKICSLVMSRIGLQELDVPVLHTFARLTELDVSGNMLRSLCPFRQEILDDPSTGFDVEIKHLLPATLVKLNASNNLLWRVDGLQHCLLLRELNLSSNQYVV